MAPSIHQTIINIMIILTFISTSFQLPLSTRKSSKSTLLATTLHPSNSQQHKYSARESISLKKSTMESTTSASNMVTLMPQFAPNYQQSTLNVLIPQNFPGKFYYPPCKCELVNQIRYYNPKTKEFYYHKAYTAMPNPRNLNGKTDRVRLEGSPDGSQYGTHNGVPILAGEPEFYPVPAISTNAATGNHINQHLPAPALALPYMPSNQHYKPYINHHMVNHNGPPQGPYMPYPMPPTYNRSVYNERMLYRNPYGGYYTYSTMLDDASGAPEAILVVAALSLWFYSVYRLFRAWQSTLNFSEASIQGPQGWDLLVNWIAERIRIRNLKVPGITTRRKTEYPAPNSDMISMNSQNDTRIVPNFATVVGMEECTESHNGGYRMEMKNITDETIQQIEDLALSAACASEGVDIQKAVTRIVEGHETLRNPSIVENDNKSQEDQVVLFHNGDRHFANFQAIHPSVSNVKNNSHTHSAISHSLSSEAKERYPQDIISTYQQYSSLPPSITTSLSTTLPAQKSELIEAPKVELLEAKPSIPSISVNSNANTKRARYGRSKTTQYICTNTIVPTTKSPCSVYMVDETQQCMQDLTNQVRTYSDSAFVYPEEMVYSEISPSLKSEYNTPSSHCCDPSNDTRQKLLLRKQVSEDVNKSVNMAKNQKNVTYSSNIVLGRYAGPNRSLRSFQHANEESGVISRFDFGSEKSANSHHLLAAEESSLGNWSSLINYNSSFDSSIRETEYEDRISPDNAL